MNVAQRAMRAVRTEACEADAGVADQDGVVGWRNFKKNLNFNLVTKLNSLCDRRKKGKRRRERGKRVPASSNRLRRKWERVREIARSFENLR